MTTSPETPPTPACSTPGAGGATASPGRRRRRSRPASDRRALRPAVRARRLRRGAGGRPARPAHPHPGPPGPGRPRAPGPPGGHRQRGGQRRRGRDPPPGAPRLLCRGRSTSTLPPPGHYATGIVFLSRDAERGRRRPHGHRRSWPARRGSCVIGWRNVPVDDRVARARSPRRPCRRCTRCSWPRPGHAAGRGRPGPGPRPPGLRPPQAGRARDRRLLLRVAVGPHHRLQGHAHLPPAGRVLPRPVRRAADQRAGPGALALLHQHLPVVAAGPPLPVPGPQRRDQHAGRQPQLDAGPRGALRAPSSSPGSSGPSPS